MAVEAMRLGAFNFIRKPIQESELIAGIRQAFKQEAGVRSDQTRIEKLLQKIKALTPREFEIYELVVKGKANKQIASKLGISERTVEVHRAQVMHKLDVANLVELVRLQVAIEQ